MRKKPQGPCMGCTPETGRSISPNCHESCEKYLNFREELDAWNKRERERRKRENMGYRLFR